MARVSPNYHCKLFIFTLVKKNRWKERIADGTSVQVVKVFLRFLVLCFQKN